MIFLNKKVCRSDKRKYDVLFELIEKKKNIYLYGDGGTGKSFAVGQLCEMLTGNKYRVFLSVESFKRANIDLNDNIFVIGNKCEEIKNLDAFGCELVKFIV